MAKGNIPSIFSPNSRHPNKRSSSTKRAKNQSPLMLMRLRELDREFTRQTKQLSALTKKLGKKLTEPIYLTGKPPKD